MVYTDEILIFALSENSLPITTSSGNNNLTPLSSANFIIFFEYSQKSSSQIDSPISPPKALIKV